MPNMVNTSLLAQKNAAYNTYGSSRKRAGIQLGDADHTVTCLSQESAQSEREKTSHST